MINKAICLIILLACLPLRSIIVNAEERIVKDKVNIIIDAAELEKLPEIFKPGLVIEGRGWPRIVYKAEDPILKKFYKEVGFKGTFRIFLYLDKVGSDKNSSASFSDYVFWLKKVKEARGRIIITLRGMPSWLTSCQADCNEWNAEYKWAMSPPKDYKQYEDLVYQIVKFYSVDNSLSDIFYEVWSEADHGGYWRGSEEEYLRLYQSFSKGVLRVKRDYGIAARVGGPGSVSWNGYRVDKEAEGKDLHKSITYKLIAYCKKNSLPLDFISFHRYGNNSKYHSIYKIGRIIREWLKKFNLDSTIPLILTEWNLWKDNIARNNEKGASFIPAMIYDMEKAGIDYHTFFSLQDFKEMDPSPEGLGLFTIFGVAKPSYNIFLMISKLGNIRLRTEISDDQNIGALATKREDGKVAILLWNYAQLDPEDAFETALLHQDYSGAFFRSLNRKKRGSMIEKIKIISKKARYREQIGRLRLDEKVKEDIEKVISNYRSALSARYNPIQVEIQIHHISFLQECSYSQWLVDKEHGNSFKDNMEFLKIIKLQIIKKALATLQEKGLPKEELKNYKALLNQIISAYYDQKPEMIESIKQKIKKLPHRKRERLKMIGDLTKKEIKKISYDFPESMYSQVMKINKSPSAKIQSIEKNCPSINDPLKISMSLKPYSIVLLFLN